MKLRNLLCILAVFTLILVSACGNADENTENEETATRVITHKLGETTIPAEPKRVVITLQRLADQALALGVTPKAIAVYGNAEYLGERIDGVTQLTFPVNPEAILAEQPDLIIADPWVEPEFYEQLGKIAPTVVIDGEDWRDSFPKIAEVLNKQEAYDQWMKEYEQKAADAKAKIAAAIGDESVMVLRVQDKYVAPWGKHEKGASNVLYYDLGLNALPNVSDTWMEQISLEALPEFDADHIFLEVRSTTEGSEAYFNSAIKDTSIWNNLKAVKSGNVYPILTDLWVEGDGPIGRSLMMDEVVSYLTGEKQ